MNACLLNYLIKKYNTLKVLGDGDWMINPRIWQMPIFNFSDFFKKEKLPMMNIGRGRVAVRLNVLFLAITRCIIANGQSLRSSSKHSKKVYMGRIWAH
jgi:hypothetical protein